MSVYYFLNTILGMGWVDGKNEFNDNPVVTLNFSLSIYNESRTKYLENPPLTRIFSVGTLN